MSDGSASAKRNVRGGINAAAFADTIAHALDEVRASAGAAAEHDARHSIAKGTPDRYRVDGTIGEGGMGRVLDATDLWFGRHVALKEILVPNAPLSITRRFLVETLVTGNLEHPGIVPVYERGVRDGRPYYVMRKLVGRTLGDALRDSSDLAARIAHLPALVRVAHTIAFAHGHGVIHRDLKPENIILGTHDEVTVIDWGIARVRSLEELGVDDKDSPMLAVAKDNHTSLGAVVGTPQYMAPEQAAGDVAAIDERTDVFALGALLYHVLSGRAPYDGATADAVVAKALTVECPEVTSFDAKVPRALAAICARAMSRKREDRFATAKEMAKALDAAIANAIGGDPSRFERVLALALGIGAVAMSAALAFFVLGIAPSWREMGLTIYFTMTSAIVGAALAVAEIATKGKYKLKALFFVVVAATFMIGFLGTLSGLLETLSTARTIANDGVKYREVIADGTYESLGAITWGAVVAPFELLLWTLANRIRRGMDK